MAKFSPDGPVWGEGCDASMPPRERNTDELFNIYEVHTREDTCSLEVSCVGGFVHRDA